MTSDNIKVRLAGVLAIALVLRLVAVFAISNPQQVPRTLAESDSPTYYVLADHILDGTGYRYAADQPPTAKRTPGYPLFLAGIFRVFGRNFSAVRVVQAIVDVATGFLIYALGVLLFGSQPIGLVGALAYALYPPAILGTTYIMTETLYTFLLVFAVAAAVYGFKARSYRLYAVSGIALGLSTLTRPGAFLLPFALLAVGALATQTGSNSYERGVGRVVGERREQRQRSGPLKALLVLCLTFVVSMLPWIVRNGSALGSFIPTSTLMGANLYKGNHLATQGAYFWSTDSLLTPELRQKLAGKSEADQDRILSSEARRTIFSHKQDVMLLTLRKIPRLWLNLGYGRAPSKKSLALAGGHLVLIALAVWGLLWLPPEARSPAAYLITTIIFSSLMYLMVASEVRFVFPLIPLMLPFSAWGGAAIYQAIRAARAQS